MRRLLALSLSLALPLGLAACGDDDGSGSGLDSVTVSGEFGEEPEVTWNGRVDVDSLQEETLIEGDGPAVEAGDSAVLHLWIGNGYSQRTAFSTYTEDSPQLVTAGEGVIAALNAALEGHTIGSRVLVASPPADAFGPGGGRPDLGIGNEDDVVLVVDLLQPVLEGPEGTSQQPPAGAPKLVENNGLPAGFDFSGSPKNAPDELQVITLIKGNGPEVEKGSTASVDYLGSVYGSKKVFDESYSREPFPVDVGAGAVIKGWDQGLVGLTAGSRVLLVIPSDLAYGKTGQGADIQPDSPLVFVVDVLATY